MLVAPEGIKVHELKSHPGVFDCVWHRIKPYELRRNDRDFQVGDALLLREWDPVTRAYSGREILVAVKYMTRGGEFELPDHLCILGLGEEWARTGR